MAIDVIIPGRVQFLFIKGPLTLLRMCTDFISDPMRYMKQPNHGCHRHQFSIFPEFSLIKVKIP